MDSEKTKKKLRETYNTIASDFGRTRQHVWQEVVDFLVTFPKGSRILDLGGGAGRHTLLAQQHGMIALCYDQSVRQLEEAKKIGVKNVLIGDLSSLPFSENSLEGIFYIAALHHLPTLEERILSLKECKRVLKRNGRVLVSVWRKGQERFKGKENTQGDVFHTWRKKEERFYHLFSKEELEKSAQDAGLLMEKCWISGDNIWLIAKKQ